MNKKVYEELSVSDCINEWIGCENPDRNIDKEDLDNMANILAFHTAKVQSMIEKNALKKDVIVYHGQMDTARQERAAADRGLSEKRNLLYEGLLYCSLKRDTYYMNGHDVKMFIYVPAGTHYLYTGEHSNVTNRGDAEIVFDKGTVLRIEKKRITKGKTYIWATMVS